VPAAQALPNAPKAFASGVRSAVVKVDNVWYRLKGSGNNDQGFPLQTSSQVVEAGQPAIETRQIRGAAFVHTAICENYYSTALAQQMDQHNVYGTNGSMGYYTYSGKNELPLGLENKEFQTACIVETTRGDRRFGTHVLAGLTLLLTELMDDTVLMENQENIDHLMELFPSERKEWGQIPFAPVPNVFEPDQVPLVPTSGVFGWAQLKCGELFMSRPATGHQKQQAWTTFVAMMDGALESVGGNVPEAKPEAKPEATTVQAMCKHICATKLVGTENNLAQLIGVNEGIFGSWMWGDYKGDTDIFTPTWQVLQAWKTHGQPITAQLTSLHDQLPVITNALLVNEHTAAGRSVHDLFAAAATAPDGHCLPKQFFNDKITGIEGEKDADPRWSEAWKEACDALHSYNDSVQNGKNGKNGRKSVLMYVYSRLGYECGRFAKLLHAKCHTSWGTYQDKICHESGWHCNAHANNMAVMAPGNSTDTYLSYLDLDMAFDATTVVDVKPSSDTYGQVGQTKEEFGLLLAFEHYNFMEVIAGNDSSTGVPPIAKDVIGSLSPALQIARQVLYDTMLKGYMHAYYEEEVGGEVGEGEEKGEGKGEGKGKAHKEEANGSSTGAENKNNQEHYSVAAFDPELHEIGMALIKLAIIKQADYIA
jgi:hypothetical protein